MSSPQLKDKIVIIGAGCFGISTAYHLLKRGFEGITIVERSMEFPAKDASSNDINRSKWNSVCSGGEVVFSGFALWSLNAVCLYAYVYTVVRTSYSDILYAKFAKEAIRAWKEDVDIWEDSYHECVRPIEPD